MVCYEEHRDIERLLALSRCLEADSRSLHTLHLAPVDRRFDAYFRVRWGHRAFVRCKDEPRDVRRCRERKGRRPTGSDVDETRVERYEWIQREGVWWAVVPLRALIWIVPGPGLTKNDVRRSNGNNLPGCLCTLWGYPHHPS